MIDNFRGTNRKLKKTKKYLVDLMNRRAVFIADKILEGNIIFMATKETAEELVDRYNLDIEVAKYEDSKIGYMFHDRREFHPLYFLKKDDQLEFFIKHFFEEFAIKPDKLVGFSISINRITDNFHGIIYQLEKEFNKDNIKKMLDDVFPKPDQIFESMRQDTIQELTDKMFIEGMMNVVGRKQ